MSFSCKQSRDDDDSYGNFFMNDQETPPIPGGRAEPAKQLHQAYKKAELPEEQDKPGGPNGKRLLTGGKYYLYQTEPKKKAFQNGREEARRLTTIHDQVSDPEDWHTLFVVISVESQSRYFKTTGNAGSGGRMALLAPKSNGSSLMAMQTCFLYRKLAVHTPTCLCTGTRAYP